MPNAADRYGPRRQHDVPPLWRDGRRQQRRGLLPQSDASSHHGGIGRSASAVCYRPDGATTAASAPHTRASMKAGLGTVDDSRLASRQIARTRTDALLASSLLTTAAGWVLGYRGCSPESLSLASRGVQTGGSSRPASRRSRSPLMIARRFVAGRARRGSRLRGHA